MAFERTRAFIGRLRGMFTNSILRGIPEVAKSESVNASKMIDSIDIWLNLYGGIAPWIKDDEPSLELPSQIAAEVAGAVVVEMEATVTGSPMGEFINEMIKPVVKNAQFIIEYLCAGGGFVLKPSVDGDKITVEMVKANAFYPTSYTNDLKITGGYFIYRYWDGPTVYTRLEKHEITEDGYLITNKAYKSSVSNSLGRPCKLSEVARWADIDEEVIIQDLGVTLFAYIKMPLGNTIDPESPLGVSVYHRAVKTIRDADEQYRSLLWEYKGGELAIDASEDAFRKVGGRPELPENKDRLFRTNKLDPATAKESEIFKAWAPSLRDSNYMSGLNKILIQIENECGLSRGTISDPNEVEKTATEYRIMKQRYARLVTNIQKSFETGLNDLIGAIYALAYLYELCPDGDYVANYKWDDSILIDSDTERQRDLEEVRDGIMQKWEYRMKWYGEDEETAKAAVQKEEPDDEDEILGFRELPVIPGQQNSPIQQPNPSIEE